MNYRKVGVTGIDVSVVAMGCWALAGDGAWGPQDNRDSIATVHAALDSGVNLFDTAEAYGDGRSTSVLGEALVGHRHQVVIADKVSGHHLSPHGIQAACEGSLRRLRTDYVDLYQIHWPSREVPLAESVGALERLREQGKVRVIGVCNFGSGDLGDLLAIRRIESNQLPYSLLWRGIEFGLQQTCIENDTSILCYSPLAQALLTGKFARADDVPEGRARTRHFSRARPQVRHGEEGFESETFAAVDRLRAVCTSLNLPMAQLALAWLLHQPGVTSVLSGARRPEQIQQNVEAATLDLSPEILIELADATDELKIKLGTNLDQYQAAAESRFR